MTIQTLTINGMSCSHCIMSVRNELSKVATVKEVALGKAVVEYDETVTPVDALKRAVDQAGYSVASVE